MRYRLQEQIERAYKRIDRIKDDILKWNSKLEEVNSGRNPRETEIINNLRVEKRRAIRLLKDKYCITFEVIGDCYGVSKSRAKGIYDRARWDKEFMEQ